jgi:5'-phosphate synthase pdxT subunit
LDAGIARNAYGRQIDSFEATVPFKGVEGSQVQGIFIRAPRFRSLGPTTEVLAWDDRNEPLAIRQGRILATTFHPELTDDTRVHRYFLEQVVALDNQDVQVGVSAQRGRIDSGALLH